MDIRPVNDDYHFWTSGNPNHQAAEINEVFSVYNWIAELAKEADGLLYCLDDEDISGWNNEFQVFVLTRGNLVKRTDVYLSPFVPNMF